jgi:hypothetical protein
MKAKTIATSLIFSFALIGAAQATPRGDTDNTPFQGVYSQNDSSANSSQALADTHQNALVASAVGDSDNAPFMAQTDSATPVSSDVGSSPAMLGDSDNTPFQG